LVVDDSIATGHSPSTPQKSFATMSISTCLVRRIVEREISTLREESAGPPAQPDRSQPKSRHRSLQGEIMKFLSIYKHPERNTPPSQEEMCKMGQMVEEWMKAGKLLGTEGCMPSSTGAQVRITNGQTIVKDGPFTEAKEVVGGFAILRADSKQQAVEYVKEFLQVMGEGECELRQLYDAGEIAQAQGAANG
jgi:hypothetical protein